MEKKKAKCRIIWFEIFPHFNFGEVEGHGENKGYLPYSSIIDLL